MPTELKCVEFEPDDALKAQASHEAAEHVWNHGYGVSNALSAIYLFCAAVVTDHRCGSWGAMSDQ